ncbi:MAG: DUF2764 domain-containing protein [Chitinispirillaceae bacterium]|nr:DUF2764 domain-containing protein [Chitinispirillaceae bacterium]
MANNYYYFVAGLPDLLLDEGKQPVSVVDFISEVEEHLTGKDLKRFKILRLPFDNINLIKLIEKKDDFDKRGSIEPTELISGLKVPDELPEYMRIFLDAFKENKPPHPGLILKEQLEWFFYEYVTEYPDPFIREWFTFELNLRNLLVALNCRRNIEHLNALSTERERAVTILVIGRNDFTEAILRSNAPDFGLGAQYSWVERVLSLPKDNLIEFEKGIDNLRWDYLNDLTLFSYFRAETVFAFFIKLLIVERWKTLDSKVGKEKLDRLIEELKSSYSVPTVF